jgi:hypothetical protein
MFNNQVSTYKAGGAPTEKSLRPSEFGRVSAWVKRTKNDLALVKGMYGHPPSIVFERPADKLIEVTAMDPPAGYNTPEQGHAYVLAADGTPAIKRNLSLSPPDTTKRHAKHTTGAGTGTTEAGSSSNAAPSPGARPDQIMTPNPDYIPEGTMKMKKTRAWVHHWVLARIPEHHQHLVINDVDKGDIEDLFMRVYGLAARDPKRYCNKAIKTRMEGLPLDFRSFNLMAYQWVLDQYEYFDTTQDAKCGDGTCKIPECDLVDLVVVWQFTEGPHRHPCVKRPAVHREGGKQAKRSCHEYASPTPT